MFGNGAQGMDREEGQSRNDENHGKSHSAECHGIRLQRSGRLGNILLARQKPGNGNLSYDRDETAQNEDNTARVIPEPGIIGQSLEPGTVIGGA